MKAHVHLQRLSETFDVVNVGITIGRRCSAEAERFHTRRVQTRKAVVVVLPRARRFHAALLRYYVSSFARNLAKRTRVERKRLKSRDSAEFVTHVNDE